MGGHPPDVSRPTDEQLSSSKLRLDSNEVQFVVFAVFWSRLVVWWLVVVTLHTNQPPHQKCRLPSVIVVPGMNLPRLHELSPGETRKQA